MKSGKGGSCSADFEALAFGGGATVASTSRCPMYLQVRDDHALLNWCSRSPAVGPEVDGLTVCVDSDADSVGRLISGSCAPTGSKLVVAISSAEAMFALDKTGRHREGGDDGGDKLDRSPEHAP